MEIISTLPFIQLKGITVTTSDHYFCPTPLVSIFETTHSKKEADADYKMVIQVYIPVENGAPVLDTDSFSKPAPIYTPVGKVEARWIIIRDNKLNQLNQFSQQKGIIESYNLWSCEVSLQSPNGEIDHVFYTHIITDNNDDPKTKRGTVTTVRNSGTGG